MHQTDNYIERNRLKCFGMPSLTGRRLTVYNVVSQLLLEQNVAVVLAHYELTLEQVRAALQYCSSLTCKTDDANGKFCDGCRLRTLQDGEVFNRSHYIELTDKNEYTIVKSLIDESIFIGPLDDLEREFNGADSWVNARELLDAYF